MAASLAVGAALTAGGPASGAGTVSQAGDVDMDVSVGVQGRVSGGNPYPVLVTIRADRPVDGELTVDTLNGPPGTEVRRAVELAAGTTKEVRLVVPGMPWSGFDLRVRLSQDGALLDEARVDPRIESLGTLVGVLPDLASRRALPLTAAVRGGLSTARFGELVPDQLALGGGAVEFYDVLAATPRDLADLDEAGRTTVLDWVALGGRLLVDGTAEALAGAGLPEAWVPAGASYAFAGLGEVRLAPGLGDGAWEEHLDMTRLRSNEQLGMFAQFEQMGPQFTATGGLAADADLRVASLGTVLVVLLAYVVVVGPITFVVLKRRRNLAGGWIVVPALALACSLVVVVAGSGLRGDARTAHATVVELTGDGRSTWRTELLAVQRGAGQVGVRLPDGASARTMDQWDGSVQAMVQRGVGDDLRLEVPADPGQAVVLPVTGVADAGWRIDVQAQSTEDDVVRGTVRHDLPVALHDVAVLAGGNDVLLGTVEPGQDVPFEVRGVDAQPLGRMGARGWRDPTVEQGGFFVFDGPNAGGGFAVGEPDGGAASVAVQLGAWSRYEREVGFGTRPPGVVRVVGWTRELDAPVGTTDGRSVERGRTAVTTVVPVQPDGRVTTSTVRRQLVAGDAVGMPDDGGAGFDAGNRAPGVMRFVLPPDGAARPGSLEMAVPPWVRDVEVWVEGDGWVPLTTAAGAAAPEDADETSTVPLPADAVREGVVLARFVARFDFAGDVGGWTIREVS